MVQATTQRSGRHLPSMYDLFFSDRFQIGWKLMFQVSILDLPVGLEGDGAIYNDMVWKSLNSEIRYALDLSDSCCLTNLSDDGGQPSRLLSLLFRHAVSTTFSTFFFFFFFRPSQVQSSTAKYSIDNIVLFTSSSAWTVGRTTIRCETAPRSYHVCWALPWKYY